jgi:peptidoglycan/xylan/chitin deacetylase (PgdA/CDA1 family)
LTISNHYQGRSGQPQKKPVARMILFFLMLAALLALAVFSAGQYLALQTMQTEFNSLEESIQNIEAENRMLREQYDEIVEENNMLREENYMLRSSVIINHGSRDTKKVAITIDDGAGAEFIGKTLDKLRELDVRATLFPMGSWVDHSPEVWARAVEEGHELGNHTYSHAFLTTISEDRIVEELDRWQESVDNALGYHYPTLFFRPPGMDGFTSAGSSRTKRFQEIIAGKGMVAVLWDVELVYALRNEVSTPARITSHVLANARGGSIVLLHFTPNDIAALPDIIHGLRRYGLEPCSLSELLLADSSI